MILSYDFMTFFIGFLFIDFYKIIIYCKTYLMKPYVHLSFRNFILIEKN
jgi:hypothetical protein